MAATDLVSVDELESIHLASLRVLSEVGIDFLHADARRRLASAGARVDGDRVRFDPDMVVEFLSEIPSEFTLHSRTPDRNLHVGGDWVTYASVASAPNYVTLDGDRCTGNRAGYQDFLRLGQMLNSVHTFGGYPVEPIDVHASTRHLEAAYDAYTLTDKSFHVYSLGRDRNLDGIEIPILLWNPVGVHGHGAFNVPSVRCATLGFGVEPRCGFREGDER